MSQSRSVEIGNCVVSTSSSDFPSSNYCNVKIENNCAYIFLNFNAQKQSVYIVVK